ncbi:MAG: aspartate 1-decarboxylase [Methylacidiphilales bacterium]|nr:aspartate 1-decarboxylase [Candidatus Methylacidiphilales bacterium]MDW8349316.1 aspartate 1-decarboxylase [Verrucomicrobiae bacterium]
MLLTVVKSKIEKACITGLRPNDDEMISIPLELIQAAGLYDHEKVLVTNLHNGRRFETVVIAGKPRSHQIELGGAAALLATIGDRITIISFAIMDDESARSFRPRSILLDKDNHQTTRPDTFFV